MSRLVFVVVLSVLTACQSDIYVRDGVTDGDRFHIDPEIMLTDDPVTQSWIAYSLTKSVCQLNLGGKNPARASSFHCEYSSRISLLDEWARQRERSSAVQDDYLDELQAVRASGFLDEYVVHFHGGKHWNVPAEVDLSGFRQWRRQNLTGFEPVTRVVGSWSYGIRRGAAH